MFKRRFLEHQVEHHSHLGWNNLGFGSFCAAVGLATGAVPWMVVAGIFIGVGVDCLRTVHKARRELKELDR